jgi:hypothetical protein
MILPRFYLDKKVDLRPQGEVGDGTEEFHGVATGAGDNLLHT